MPALKSLRSVQEQTSSYSVDSRSRTAADRCKYNVEYCMLSMSTTSGHDQVYFSRVPFLAEAQGPT